MGAYNLVVLAHADDESAVGRAASQLSSIAVPSHRDEVLNDGRARFIDLSDDVLDDIEMTAATLAKTSRSCGVTLVWIAAVSSADAFLYLHWAVGWLQRALVYGEAEDFCWSRAEGRVQEWEGTAFAGHEVRGTDGVSRVVGGDEGEYRGPQQGDASLNPRVMNWAGAALGHWRETLRPEIS
jgi:hypothetical protein